MSETVPEGWRINSIAECCEILDSQRIPLNSEERSKRLGEYPYYGANGIQGYIDDFIFDGDAILVAEDGGNFDQYAERPIAQWVTGKYWVNNHAHILRAKENDLDKWIFYSLVHKNILKFINGGTRAKLNQSDLREIQIYLPPLPEQKKIASILTSVDEVIETTQRQIDKLQDLKKATMNELLTKGIGHTEFKDSELGRIPKSWEVCLCEDVCKKIMVGIVITPSKYYSDYGVPVFRSANVSENGINFQNLKYITPESNEILRKSKLQTGDILTVRTGYPGTSAVVEENAKDCNCVDVIISRPNSDVIMSAFLCNWINSEYGKGEVLKKQGGLAQQHFNVGDLRELKLVLPPLDEQKSILRVIRSISSRLKLQNQKLAQTKSLKKSLMQDLLTGKVRVQVN